NVSTLMTPRHNAGAFGETATTMVDHPGGGAYDCLTWAAVIFSTAVADVDHDGIPDGLEDSPVAGGLKDPNGMRLPDLHAMGASSSHKDIFIEVNGMWASPETKYGSSSAPFDTTHVQVTDH